MPAVAAEWAAGACKAMQGCQGVALEDSNTWLVIPKEVGWELVRPPWAGRGSRVVSIREASDASALSNLVNQVKEPREECPRT
mmetsp:Transcript_1082/g.3375  ORF Transcript_1082/g.3375 Transcript_1082/m.3375 type:complete len:83 (-) Transcript_1082:344-592(-)